jgi:hypothetical protein
MVTGSPSSREHNTGWHEYKWYPGETEEEEEETNVKRCAVSKNIEHIGQDKAESEHKARGEIAAHYTQAQ